VSETPGVPIAQPPLRCSDADRERVAAALSAHCADGRLTLDELAERIERTLAATTHDELATITADLPSSDAPAPTPVARAPRRTKHVTVAVMSEAKKKGRWRAGEHLVAVAVMGSVVLDLRSAELAGPSVTIACLALMGSVKIMVPPGIDVDFGGIGLMGSAQSKVDEEAILPGSPLVRVNSLAVMGDVSVVSARPKHRKKAVEASEQPALPDS
jgi:hypothetical protein